jgi:hypothetical protein
VKKIEPMSVSSSYAPIQIILLLSMFDVKFEERLPINFPSFSPSDEVNTEVNNSSISFCFDFSRIRCIMPCLSRLLHLSLLERCHYLAARIAQRRNYPCGGGSGEWRC